MATFTPPSFTTDNAKEWLKSLDPQLDEVAFFTGPYIEDMPDQIVTVTAQPGPGLALEGIADDKVYQVRCRGYDHDIDSAEALALFIDDAVLRATFPVDVGTKRIFFVTRQGNPPAPLSATPDNAHRWEYIANYWFRVATDL